MRSKPKPPRKPIPPQTASADAFPVDHNIPIPEPRGRHAKYPWSLLKIGDSFFVQGQTSQTFGPARQYAQTRHGHVYVSRTVTEAGTAGVRIWRTE